MSRCYIVWMVAHVDTQLHVDLIDGLLLHPPMMKHGMFSMEEEGAYELNILNIRVDKIIRSWIP